MSANKKNTAQLFRYKVGNDRIYTTDSTEIKEENKEGSVGIIFTVPTKGTLPFYRYFNPAKKHHFYTTNKDFIGVTESGQIGRYGTVCEGTAGYIYRKEVPGTVPLYRYCHLTNNHDLFTPDPNEIGETVFGRKANGFRCEGFAGWVYPDPESADLKHVDREEKTKADEKEQKEQKEQKVVRKTNTASV